MLSGDSNHSYIVVVPDTTEACPTIVDAATPAHIVGVAVVSVPTLLIAFSMNVVVAVMVQPAPVVTITVTISPSVIRSAPAPEV